MDDLTLALLKKRLERRTNKSGPIIREELGACWIWTGSISSTGYGSMRFQKRGYSTHAVAFLVEYGRLPESPLQIRHRCDNRSCVNPAHLLEGTHQQNMQDMVERGRHPSSVDPSRLPRGLAHHHGKKTHCPKGHLYSPENTYIFKSGSRACKTCMIQRAKEFKAKRRANARSHCV